MGTRRLNPQKALTPYVLWLQVPVALQLVLQRLYQFDIRTHYIHGCAFLVLSYLIALQ